MNQYWEQRKNLEYYKIIKQYIESLGKLESILDIGCADTPIATWGLFDKRYTIDIKKWPQLSNVNMIVGRWPDCSNSISNMSLITCLQTIEHVINPKNFCDEIFKKTNHVIISLPWKWSKKSDTSHIQDPIDEKKIEEWIKYEPIKKYIVGKPERIILIYKE